jgi:hypothetical protein
MTPIFTKMGGDTICTGFLCQQRRRYRAGMQAATRIANGCNMVNIYAQTKIFQSSSSLAVACPQISSKYR